MLRRPRWELVALALILVCPTARAITVDGTLDAEYGSAIVVQTLQTNSTGAAQLSGDNNQGQFDFANGSELDAGYAIVEDDTLHLFLTGNLGLMLNANQNSTVRHILDVFLDVTSGGQQSLSVFSGFVLNGLTFDAAFAADHLFELEGDDNGFNGPRLWNARYSEVPSSGSALVYLGFSTAGGPGVLVGGTNPHSVRVTIDNRNVIGVTAGCAGSSGAGATRGIEWTIPLSAIGNPDGCIRIAAFVRNGSNLSNQALGALPSGTCAIGSASFVDFTSYAGDQFLEVCPTTGVAEGGGRLALALLGSNPSRGEALRVAFTVPDATPARLQVVDGAGRVLHDEAVGGGTSGRFVRELSMGRALAPGMYWLRLLHRRAEVTRKLAVVR